MAVITRKHAFATGASTLQAGGRELCGELLFFKRRNPRPGNKKLLLPILSIVIAITLLVAVGLFTGTMVSDVIRMENKDYEKHKRSIVMFPHKKHPETKRW